MKPSKRTKSTGISRRRVAGMLKLHRLHVRQMKSTLEIIKQLLQQDLTIIESVQRVAKLTQTITPAVQLLLDERLERLSHLRRMVTLPDPRLPPEPQPKRQIQRNPR